MADQPITYPCGCLIGTPFDQHYCGRTLVDLYRMYIGAKPGDVTPANWDSEQWIADQDFAAMEAKSCPGGGAIFWLYIALAFGTAAGVILWPTLRRIFLS